MTSKAKISLLLHLALNTLGQTSLALLVPEHHKALLQLTLAILGALAAWFDQSYSQ